MKSGLKSPDSRVPEVFKGREGKSRERGTQGGGSESPQSRERGILPYSTIFFGFVDISTIKTSKIRSLLPPDQKTLSFSF